MPKTFDGTIKFPSNFDVKATRPLDNRLVVDSKEDLTNGTIDYPYQGMVVNIAGSSELWILLTSGIEASHNPDNWKLVTGSGDGMSEEVEQKIEEIWERLGLAESDIDNLQEEVDILKMEMGGVKNDVEDIKESLGTVTDLVGDPGTESEPPTGIFEELDTLKKNVKGASLSNYILPVMTQEMVDGATIDPDVDFDGSEDPHILVEYNPLGTTPRTNDDIYMGLIHDMMGAIRSLQAEVARLRNTFDYGIDSYKNTRTAKSVTLGGMNDIDIDEPLWAIDPGYLSGVNDNPNFNTLLDINHSFITVGTGTIDASVDGQLTFVDCKGRFQDGNAQGENPTLYLLKDSKLITYLVTDKPDIKMTLVSLDNKAITREVDFAEILRGNRVNKYGFCVVISRKVRVGEEDKGFNYIYFSIINYENDEKLFEGYLTDDNRLVPTRVDVPARFSIQSLDFDRLTLSRMKFYTKFEDFTEEVISSMPSEDDYKYEVAHIAIR